jgi:hypothetical protein
MRSNDTDHPTEFIDLGHPGPDGPPEDLPQLSTSDPACQVTTADCRVLNGDDVPPHRREL